MADTQKQGQSKYQLKMVRRKAEARKRGLPREATWPEIWAHDEAVEAAAREAAQRALDRMNAVIAEVERE